MKDAKLWRVLMFHDVWCYTKPVFCEHLVTVVSQLCSIISSINGKQKPSTLYPIFQEWDDEQPLPPTAFSESGYNI